MKHTNSGIQRVKGGETFEQFGSTSVSHLADFGKAVMPKVQLSPIREAREIFGSHDAFRNHFPILRRIIDRKRLVLVDNATTGQVAEPVLKSISRFLSYHVENVHRSTGNLPAEADQIFARGTHTAGRFVGASQEEIIWCKNTTEGLNTLVLMFEKYFGDRKLGKQGSNILTTLGDHNSCIVPLQRLADRHPGLEVRYANIEHEGPNQGRVSLNDFKKKINAHTKLLVIGMASNLTGVVNPIAEMISIFRSKNQNGFVILDCAQSAPHLPLSVRDLDCDAAVVAGHKLAHPAESFIYLSSFISDELSPHMAGGGVVEEVHTDSHFLFDTPDKFHYGTPQLANIRALDAAVRFLTFSGLTYFEPDFESVSWVDEVRELIGGNSNHNANTLFKNLRRALLRDEAPLRSKLVRLAMSNIMQHEADMTTYFLETLAEELGDTITLLGPKKVDMLSDHSMVDRIGVISVRSSLVPVKQFGEHLDREGIVVRAGLHCCNLGVDALGFGDSHDENDRGAVRFSLTHFNNRDDIDRIVTAIKKIHRLARTGKLEDLEESGGCNC